MGVELLPLALVTQRGRHDALKVAHVGDPSMTVGQKMLDAPSRAAEVVGENRVRIEERRGTVDEDERGAGFALVEEVTAVVTREHDDAAVHPARGERGDN